MNYDTIESEFMRPLVNGWMGKLEHSARNRQPWKEQADECMMFYSRSAAAMWNPAYSKKFWSNIKLPRFRITMNKAFEMVSIFGPNLFWDIPHRNVEVRDMLELEPGALGQDQQSQMIAQQIMQMQAKQQQADKTTSYLVNRWLNYTPREQPGGGLTGHSMRATYDALIKGRGCLATRPYKMPGSGRVLTGSFREPPEHIYLDPDFNDVDECQWMAIKHVDTHRDVEERFQLPRNSLRKKATLESTFQYSELMTDESSPARRKDGMTNDLIVWYEIFSKTGCGCSHTTMDNSIKEHMDKVAGKYCYLAICADVPWPLNLPAEKIRGGATDDVVKDAYKWPIPFWMDDRWPVEFLDFYYDPDSAWPVPPLGPGIGELKLLNLLISWFANRVWSSSRDFWAVAGQHIKHYEDYLKNGDDQAIIPMPPGIRNVNEGIQVLSQPETRQDMTQLIGFIADNFDRRVGLTATAYGQNEDATQNRTAEETISKNRAVNVRPEYMQKQVINWQGEVAKKEAYIARLFVKPEDVEAQMGAGSGMLWSQFVATQDVERLARQFQYTISASSIRRPNRDRDIANFQQVMSNFAPVLAEYGGTSGNFGPFNGLMGEWAKLHDAKIEDMMIPPPDEEKQAQQEQLQQQMQQLEMQEKKAKADKLTAEAQSIMAEMQMKPMEMQQEMAMAQVQLQTEQMRQAGEAQKIQGEELKAQIEQQRAMVQAQIEQVKAASQQRLEEAKQRSQMILDEEKHDQEMVQDAEAHDQEMEQKREAARQGLQAKLAESRVKQQAMKQQASKPQQSGNSNE